MHTFFCPTRIRMGSGVHKRVGEEIKGLGAKSVLLLVDGALRASPVFDGICASLREHGVSWNVFSEIEPDPSDITVEKALEACRGQKAEALIALGGGSTIDVAKAVGILRTNGGTIQEYEGLRKFSVPRLPLVAIPTTAGTGSEVSGSCVITDTRRKLKLSIRHPELNPADIALLDPMAVMTLPAHVAMHAGMDAFVHAFESFVSLGANLFTDALNLHALGLINRSILPFIANRSNEQAALDMLCGSALAGMTFGITGLGNVHCISRFIGIYFHLPHGLANALCLPHVAEFNRIAVPNKYARLAELFGCRDPGMSDTEAARETVSYIRQLCQDADVPMRLRDVGVDRNAFPEIASLCVKAGYNRWNPRFTTEDDFLRLLESAY